MGRIAVAGGTGSVGRTFVQELSGTQHEIFVLSRDDQQPSQNPESKKIKNVKIDYSDVASLTQTLTTHNIDTVLSALNMNSPAASTSQINLIAAADLSPCTTHFIPSEYGIIATPATIALDPFSEYLLLSADALARTTSLTYTRIATGTFMDWWATPHIKTNLPQLDWAINVRDGVAAIPGTGNEVLSFTYLRDLARYVVGLLNDKDAGKIEWAKQVALVGQDTTFNQLLALAEKYTGKKFDKVEYDTEEKLRSGQVTDLSREAPGNEYLLEITRIFGLMAIEGMIKMPETQGFRVGLGADQGTGKKRELLTVDEMMRVFWSGSQTEKDRRNGE